MEEQEQPFDWMSIEITEEEFYKRARRVDGEATCQICGKLYNEHPMEDRALDFNKQPFLNRLCNGTLGKL